MLASIGLGLECWPGWPGWHGKVTIYDGAMFHKAGRFEMIFKLKSFCECIFELHMFDNVAKSFQVSAELPWYVMLAFLWGDPCTTVDTW